MDSEAISFFGVMVPHGALAVFTSYQSLKKVDSINLSDVHGESQGHGFLREAEGLRVN